MTYQLPPEMVREVDALLERVWSEEVAARHASRERLRRAEELMAQTGRELAEMQAAEADRMAASLADLEPPGEWER